jgi:hypothetical protein
LVSATARSQNLFFLPEVLKMQVRVIREIRPEHACNNNCRRFVLMSHLAASVCNGKPTLSALPVSGHPLELFDNAAWDTYCPVNRLRAINSGAERIQGFGYAG